MRMRMMHGSYYYYYTPDTDGFLPSTPPLPPHYHADLALSELRGRLMVSSTSTMNSIPATVYPNRRATLSSHSSIRLGVHSENVHSEY